MYAKNLSQRLSSYIGLNGKSAWGPKARELGIEAIDGHSPVATSVLDFGTNPFPSAAGLAATTLSWTATEVGAVAGNSIVCNSSNGYMLVTPGTAADTGYACRAFTANVSAKDLMQFAPATSVQSTSIREIYWGARIAISTNTTWDNAISFGLWGDDSTPLSTTTGLPTVVSGIMFNFDITGALRINRSVSGVNSGTVCTPTATSLAHSSSSFRARDFHDYFIWVRLVGVAGSADPGNIIEAYVDGKLVGQLLATTQPSATASTMYNSIAVYNGDAANCTLACTEIVNGYLKWTV